jgi:DNA polymerase-3 subunit epsilon
VSIEPRALHDTRLRLALAPLRLKSWPFPGAVAIREPAPGFAGSVLHVIDRWRHIGSATSEEDLRSIVVAAAEAALDMDMYRIVRRWLQRVDARACIPLPARDPAA